jgi:hypothetical protein
MVAGLAARQTTLKARGRRNRHSIATEFRDGEPGVKNAPGAPLRGHGGFLQRHDDLAEMLVGFHVLERLADVVKGKHLVDRQLQLA